MNSLGVRMGVELFSGRTLRSGGRGPSFFEFGSFEIGFPET